MASAELAASFGHSSTQLYPFSGCPIVTNLLSGGQEFQNPFLEFQVLLFPSWGFQPLLYCLMDAREKAWSDPTQDQLVAGLRGSRGSGCCDWRGLKGSCGLDDDCWHLRRVLKEGLCPGKLNNQVCVRSMWFLT